MDQLHPLEKTPNEQGSSSGSAPNNTTVDEQSASQELATAHTQVAKKASAPAGEQSVVAAKPITPVAGLGVDIIEIERMERALARTPRMYTRVFSEQERKYANSKSKPVVHYALFFAAKEAVLKALGTGFAGTSAFTDVEVDHDRFGKPVPLLHGRAKEIADAQGIVDMQLSLSYTRSVGVASAVAIKEQDRPKIEEKIDPRAELAKQFKELKAMFDEDSKASDDEASQDDEAKLQDGVTRLATEASRLNDDVKSMQQIPDFYEQDAKTTQQETQNEATPDSK